MRGPRAAQHNVVLVVEEVGRVRWVEGHGAEAGVSAERRAGPFPDTAKFGAAGEGVVALGGDGGRVPAGEADVGAGEIGEGGG